MNGVELSNRLIKTRYEFWTKKLFMNVTQLDNEKITLTQNFYELHGQGVLDNIDVTDWVDGDTVQFRVGMHITRSMRDWSVINVNYKGAATQVSDFSCVDGFSDGASPISLDLHQNCQIKDNNEGETKIELYEVNDLVTTG